MCGVETLNFLNPGQLELVQSSPWSFSLFYMLRERFNAQKRYHGLEWIRKIQVNGVTAGSELDRWSILRVVIWKVRPVKAVHAWRSSGGDGKVDDIRWQRCKSGKSRNPFQSLQFSFGTSAFKNTQKTKHTKTFEDFEGICCSTDRRPVTRKFSLWVALNKISTINMLH